MAKALEFFLKLQVFKSVSLVIANFLTLLLRIDKNQGIVKMTRELTGNNGIAYFDQFHYLI